MKFEIKKFSFCNQYFFFYCRHFCFSGIKFVWIVQRISNPLLATQMCANKLPTIIFCKFKFLRLLSHVTYDFSFSHTCNVDCTKYIDMYMLIGTAFSEFLRELTFNFNTVDFLHLTPTTHLPL